MEAVRGASPTRQSRPARRSKGRQTPPSTLAMQIVRAALDPDVSVRELAEMAEGDATFAMRMLSVVNSAAYGLGSDVTDVTRAAAMLGADGMRNLALSLSLTQMIPAGEHGSALLCGSLRRGIAARLIAGQIGEAKRANDFFTVGLLLETGLLMHAANNLDVAASIARSPADTRLVQERAAGFVPHNERGAALAVEWAIGEEVAEAIRHHHDAKPPAGTLARAGWAAERIAAVFECADFETARREARAAAKVVGIAQPAFDEILRALPKLVADAAKGFQRDVGEQPDIDALADSAAERLVEMNVRFQSVIRDLERMIVERDALTTELQKANERLREAAMRDGLTGLINHRTFQESLARDLSRASRNGGAVSLVMVDIDHFKSINDHHGHPAGDAVLRTVAKLLSKALREGDVAARYGGEEFALILPNTDAAGALVVAERVRAQLAKRRMKVGNKQLGVTASFGVATVEGDACRGAAPTLISAADRALYEAKRSGRDRVVPAPPI